MSETEILIRVEGKAGRITLNRPKALNALSYNMVLKIEQALIDWQDDDAVSLILIDGAGDRAFCAGGDIEDMYQAGRAGDFSYGPKFWIDEYRMNAYLAGYNKPYVAFMDGFVMGGGVGVSAHGSHRIVTERSMVAMPECGIGLIPDVGGTHLLGKAPGYLGEFAGLTGHRMGAADAIHMDFADYHVASDKLEALAARLCETGDVVVIKEFESEPDAGTLGPAQSDIDAVFGLPTVSEIVGALQGNEADWAVGALKALGRGAPLSLICALEMIREARALNDIRKALDLEFKFTSRSAQYGEFLEGIRAAIIDKDRKPQWQYLTVESVPDDLVCKMLAPVE